MVLVQVSIGGITRLTDSGLSMTSWEPIKGALPPLTEEAWVDAFNDYRQYPEFYQKNADFTLKEFKGIYWWEYIHRAWARLIGLVFIFPFLFFWRKGLISRKLGRGLFGVVILGAAQAVMGWVMVKSGMDDNPWVSPYRLTMHLFLALALFAWLFHLVLPPRRIAQGERGANIRTTNRSTIKTLPKPSPKPKLWASQARPKPAAKPPSMPPKRLPPVVPAAPFAAR